VATLPAAGILMGIGYAIANTSWGADSTISVFLQNAGGAILDNLPLLFALGIGIGMANDAGASGLAALVSWLMITRLLSTDTVTAFTGAEANVAFANIENVFIGIIAGVIGS